MKKKHPEHVNLERWLVSYADFITLLFAFFVVMYAMSMENVSKVRAAAESIRKAFGESGGSVGMIQLGGNGSGSTANAFDAAAGAASGRVLNMPQGKTATASDPTPEMQEIKELLEETISLQLGVTDVSDQLEMLYDSRGLIVRLAAKDFFDVGAVDVRPDLRPLLDRIGRVIAGTKRPVRVEGHADVSEAKTRGYASDWELSAGRAAWVVKYWIQRFNLKPSRFAAAGYGHYHPVSDGKNEWGRAKNRRIEIIILNQAYDE